MIDETSNFKRTQINSYFSSIYENLNEENINANTIKHDLRDIIGEVPGVELNYKKETLLVEDGTEPISHNKLESVTIYYTYDVNFDGKYIPTFDKVTYII